MTEKYLSLNLTITKQKEADSSVEREAREASLVRRDVAALARGSPRSRSGSPAACYDVAQFEKEKSPFLAVKSLLKPIKKSRLSEAPDPVPDWRQLAGEQIRARQGRAGRQHKVPS